MPSEYAPPSAYDAVSEDSKLRLPETKINVKNKIKRNKIIKL